MKSNIQWLVAKAGYKQYEVAKKMGVSAQTFNNWATGKAYPRMDRAAKLAKILGCSVNDLYEEE